MIKSIKTNTEYERIKALETFFKKSSIRDSEYCLKICDDTGIESVKDLFENKNELGNYFLKPIFLQKILNYIEKCEQDEAKEKHITSITGQYPKDIKNNKFDDFIGMSRALEDIEKDKYMVKDEDYRKFSFYRVKNKEGYKLWYNEFRGL